MRKLGLVLAVAFLISGIFAGSALAAELKNVIDVYPLLPAKGLGYAKMTTLPENVILRYGEMQLTKEDLANRLKSLPGMIASQCADDLFFGLEIVSMPSILADEAQKGFTAAGQPVPQVKPDQLVQAYMGFLISKMGIKVTDDEIKSLMKEQNVPVEKIEEVRANFTQYLLAQKQNSANWKLWAETGKRVNIEVSEAWVKEQAENVKDSVVDKARKSGKPSIAIFLSGLSRNKAGREAMTVIIDKYAKEHEGKVEILRLDLMSNAVLAMRFGVSFGNSGLIFFDKNGKETHRTLGFMSEHAYKTELENILK